MTLQSLQQFARSVQNSQLFVQCLLAGCDNAALFFYWPETQPLAPLGQGGVTLYRRVRGARGAAGSSTCRWVYAPQSRSFYTFQLSIYEVNPNDLSYRAFHHNQSQSRGHRLVVIVCKQKTSVFILLCHREELFCYLLYLWSSSQPGRVGPWDPEPREPWKP